MNCFRLSLFVSVIISNMAFSQYNIELSYSAPFLNIDNNKDKIIDNNKTFEVQLKPINETISIKFNNATNIESIKMLNNSSKVVFEQGKSRGIPYSSIEIPIEELESGVYYIRVKTESGVQTQRIIITK